MSSFEEHHERKQAIAGGFSQIPSKLPLKRFEPALHKFTKIAIPTDLERLGLHKTNMEKYYEMGSWHELNIEQINASRTVQQLKANIKEMDNTRRQVQESDLEKFDLRVAPCKQEALNSIKSFRQVQCLYARKSKQKSNNEQSIHLNDLENRGTEKQAPDLASDDQLLKQTQEDCQIPDEDAVASWDSLRENLVQLNELIHDFSDVVHEQQTSIDTIVDNVEEAQVNVEEGTVQLGNATKIKAMMGPVIGAVVGGVLAGPVGMMAGFKVGGIAAAATGMGAVGFTVGSLLKGKKNEAVDKELENLNKVKEETQMESEALASLEQR